MQKDDHVGCVSNDDKGQFDPFSPVGGFAEKPPAYDVGNVFPRSPIQVQNWHTWMLNITEKTIANEKGTVRRLRKRLSDQPFNVKDGRHFSRQVTMTMKLIESHGSLFLSMMDSEIERVIQFRDVSLKSQDPVDKKLIDEFAFERYESGCGSDSHNHSTWAFMLGRTFDDLGDILEGAISEFAHSQRTLQVLLTEIEGSDAGSLPIISALNDVSKELGERISGMQVLQEILNEFRTLWKKY